MATVDPQAYAAWVNAQQEARAEDATTANQIMTSAKAFHREHETRMALFADNAWQDGEVVEFPGEPPRVRVGDNLLIASCG